MSTTMDCGECDECGAELDEGQSSGTCEACAEGESNTTVGFVSQLMNDSRFGPLAELFVMEALKKYAGDVAALDPNELEKTGLWSWISPEAWVAIGQEFNGKIEARSKANNPAPH